MEKIAQIQCERTHLPYPDIPDCMCVYMCVCVCVCVHVCMKFQGGEQYLMS